ncbi:MAG: response regulator, partial [Chloroflexi bacterium]
AVNGIVRSHRAALTINTAPNQGTTFSVFFPISMTDTSAELPTPVKQTTSIAATTSNDLPQRGVLIVDDEAEVRHVALRMLQRLGFTAYAAGSSEEAHQVMAQFGEQIILALIDLTMPDITGDVLATDVLQHYPHVHVILMSGFSQQELPANLRNSGRASFLAKPFTIVALSAAIRNALSSHAV